MNLFRSVGILITCILFYLNFIGEVIPVNNGMGWDGRLYAAYTAHLNEYIDQKGINEYRFQRILMPVVLNKSMKAMDIKLTDPNDPNSPNIANMVLGFKLFNVLFLLLALLYYLLISRKLNLSPINEFFGLMALFWIFPVLKLPSYNPIITDTGAFAFGMVITYYFLTNNRIVNLILILLGSFIYPTFILFGLLLMFPREVYSSENKSFRLERFILPVLYLLIFAWAYFLNHKEFSDTYAEIKPTNTNALFLSVLIALFYCYSISAFFPDIKKIKEILTKINWVYVIGIVGIIILVKYLTSTYAVPQDTQLNNSRYLINIMKQSVANPGVFFVAHVIYLGWIPILVIWMGKKIVPTIRENGYGIAILFAILGLMSLGSETRQLINFYPLLVIIVLITLEKIKPLKPWVVVSIGISYLILSRFWYTINSDGDMSKNLLEGPGQRYFQFCGPWMSNSSYMMNLLIVLLATVAFFILYKTGNLFELSVAKAKLKPVVVKKRK